MDLAEIKKYLYRNKPIAKRISTGVKYQVYKVIDDNIGEVIFKIPLHESVGFSSEENAQLLIRWINQK